MFVGSGLSLHNANNFSAINADEDVLPAPALGVHARCSQYRRGDHREGLLLPADCCVQTPFSTSAFLPRYLRVTLNCPFVIQHAPECSCQAMKSQCRTLPVTLVS
jgi:hypothetical protein